MKSDFLETAIEAAKAGAAVLERWAGKFTVREKSRANLVTEADAESERTIYEIIRAKFPDHGFLGEEGLSETGRDASYRWVIDPLDGTSNYVHRFPFYAVSIALEKDGELIVGVILDPNRDELFTAIRGEGAFLNGQPISSSVATELGEALVVVSLPPAVTREHPAIQQFLSVLTTVQHVQRTGSAALNLCYVASGRIDAFFSQSLKPWDIAAGALIVEEAGGRITKMNGNPLDIEIPDLLATNGTKLHDNLRGIL